MYARAMLVISVVLCTAAVSYSQQVRVAEWSRDYSRCRCVTPFTPFEGGGSRGYGGGPVRSAPNYSRAEIEGMERARYGREVVDTSHDILRERARREAEARQAAAAVRAAKGDRWQPTSDWRAPRMDPGRYRDLDPGRGQLRYDPSRIGNSYFREPVYGGPSRSTGDGRRTSSEGSSRSRDAGAVRDRTRDTPGREIKDWFDRVLEKGSRRP
jgi:hypothetical protein